MCCSFDKNLRDAASAPPGPLTSTPPLPRGWREYWDTQTQRLFYADDNTRTTTFTDPRVAERQRVRVEAERQRIAAEEAARILTQRQEKRRASPTDEDVGAAALGRGRLGNTRRKVSPLQVEGQALPQLQVEGEALQLQPRAGPKNLFKRAWRGVRARARGRRTMRVAPVGLNRVRSTQMKPKKAKQTQNKENRRRSNRPVQPAAAAALAAWLPPGHGGGGGIRKTLRRNKIMKVKRKKTKKRKGKKILTRKKNTRKKRKTIRKKKNKRK